ncbi:pyrophosphate--fructose 6-phosphate 1-phosphotransferase subunit beta-like [Rutidosis leptorrhynchoides]|uniref:pyrophosphate--fructose 6-phosphate 1-phosphotransferase subunit beta-like n=1 Tax=Rutidosis leptorrhynchoides TaxID=125765 RepID=UPI003A98DB40
MSTRCLTNCLIGTVVRLMGRAGSHITLECALQTHPNITIIGEEVAEQKQTLKSVTDYITNIICNRAEAGYNYVIIVIPEGLINFILEVQQLIAELNEILAHDVVDQEGEWKKKLRSQSHDLFETLPKAIQEQLLLERDPHGIVQVAKKETEKILIQMVEAELESRKKAGTYNKDFKGQPHFFDYEGRCGLPSNFDSNYCYALGYGAAALMSKYKMHLILISCKPPPSSPKTTISLSPSHDQEPPLFHHHETPKPPPNITDYTAAEGFGVY